EPSMFMYTQNSAPSVAPLTAAEKSTLVSASEFGVTFAVVVSKDIADALRAAGKVSATNPAVASMTKSEVATIFKGDAVAWQQVYADSAFSGASGLRVCRRETGSGTQATMQAYFTNFPCASASSGAVNFVTTAASDASIPYTVVENDTGGKMVNCVANAAGGSIGFVGIDQSGIPANVEKVAIDGVEPTFANAQSGKYDLFVENSLNYRSTITSETNGAAKKALMDRIKAEGSSAATLFTVFGASANKNAGALTGNGNAYPAANANEATVTFRGTRNGNSCSPVTLAPEAF
ncbi:MAG TPA: hypothetical protein VFM46_06440, partial [Pseudomonadales bacterium]|nr:hypothetical protein [Pseudomonadales bacterium]